VRVPQYFSEAMPMAILTDNLYQRGYYDDMTTQYILTEEEG